PPCLVMFSLHDALPICRRRKACSPSSSVADRSAPQHGPLSMSRQRPKWVEQPTQPTPTPTSCHPTHQHTKKVGAPAQSKSDENPDRNMTRLNSSHVSIS